MRILLADDEELQLKRLEQCVRAVLPNEEIFSFANPEKALNAGLEKGIDIAFLDIEMPVISGIALAKKLKRKNPSVNIIFVTAYEHYALESFRLHASGYVLKPVSEAKVRDEVNALRFPIDLKSTKKLQVKCFGNFEVFHDGKPVNFSYSKSKEVFAYLVDREGSSISVNELNAVMWEEDHKSYLRNLICDIQATLKGIGAEDVFIKRRSECSIDVSQIDCDAYEYKANNPNAINLYRGEYMMQYPWALFKDDVL